MTLSILHLNSPGPPSAHPWMMGIFRRGPYSLSSLFGGLHPNSITYYPYSCPFQYQQYSFYLHNTCVVRLELDFEHFSFHFFVCLGLGFYINPVQELYCFGQQGLSMISLQAARLGMDTSNSRMCRLSVDYTLLDG